MTAMEAFFYAIQSTENLRRMFADYSIWQAFKTAF